MEQAERAAQAPVTQVKIKGGRSKVVKMKDETMPTPQGRRVVPRITSAMKDQAVKKGGAKKGKVKVGVGCLHCCALLFSCARARVCVSKPIRVSAV